MQIFDADVEGNVFGGVGGAVDTEAECPLADHVPTAAGQRL